MSAQYTIVCDDCKKEGPATKRGIAAALARKLLWTHPARGRDRCASCTVAPEEKNPPALTGYA